MIKRRRRKADERKNEINKKDMRRNIMTKIKQELKDFY